MVGSMRNSLQYLKSSQQVKSSLRRINSIDEKDFKVRMENEIV